MKILVCVKQVPDVDLVKMDPETGNLIRAGVPTMLNPLDGNALEAALRAKEKYGAEVTVITMGPPMAESTLRDCLAVGADKAVLISGRPFGGADTLSTSYTIAAAAAMEGSFDLVFAGKESVDGATGQMGPQLAERMSMAQITNTLLIDEIDENAGTIVAERETDAGVEVIEAKLPCLLTIEKTNYPARLPGLKGKLAAKKASLEPERIGVPGSGTIVPEIYPPKLPEPGQMIDEGSDEANSARIIDILAGQGVV